MDTCGGGRIQLYLGRGKWLQAFSTWGNQNLLYNGCKRFFLICLSSIWLYLILTRPLYQHSLVQNRMPLQQDGLSPRNPQEVINFPQGLESLIPSWELPLERMISGEFRRSISSVSKPRGKKQRQILLLTQFSYYLLSRTWSSGCKGSRSQCLPSLQERAILEWERGDRFTKALYLSEPTRYDRGCLQ